MNTMRAENETAYERVIAALARSDAAQAERDKVAAERAAERDKAAAERDKAAAERAAERDKELIRTLALLIGAGTAIIGVLIALGFGLLSFTLNGNSKPVIFYGEPPAAVGSPPQDASQASNEQGPSGPQSQPSI